MRNLSFFTNTSILLDSSCFCSRNRKPGDKVKPCIMACPIDLTVSNSLYVISMSFGSIWNSCRRSSQYILQDQTLTIPSLSFFLITISFLVYTTASNFWWDWGCTEVTTILSDMFALQYTYITKIPLLTTWNFKLLYLNITSIKKRLSERIPIGEYKIAWTKGTMPSVTNGNGLFLIYRNLCFLSLGNVFP